MTAILCVDSASPSDSLMCCDEVSHINLNLYSCAGEVEGMEILSGPDILALMVVSSQLAEGSALSLIRGTRMLPNRATLPIAFITDDRNLGLAQGALRAGATEIFLRSDKASFAAFVSECANPVEGEMLTGRVLLAEDSDMQFMIVSDLCSSLGLAVDRCSTVESGIEYLRKSAYQAVLIDVVLLGVQSGLSLLRHIRQLDSPQSNVPVLVISGFEDRARRIEAFRCGADDFLTKPFFSEEFVWRLRRIMQSDDDSGSGQTYANTIEGFQQASPMEWQHRGLSRREREVCERMLQGDSDKQISGDLGIAFWTVRTHVRNIFTKLGLINRRELMSRYTKHDEP